MHNSVLDNDMKTILVTEEEIDRIVTRIAAEIDRDYAHLEGNTNISTFSGFILFLSKLFLSTLTANLSPSCKLISLS